MIGKNIAIKAASIISFVIVFVIAGILASPDMLHPAYGGTNPNLFVSAENPQWNNYFAGPQVIQVIVADSDINRLDQAYGEPVVTVNGKRLRMAQNTDGNWYAYFADRNQAIAADKTVGLAGKGLDFGQFCSSTSAVSPSFTDTKGFTVAHSVTGSVDKPTNAAAFGACTNLAGTGSLLEHVVRQNKTLTHPNGTVTLGQIGLGNGNAWPIIQLYDFSAIPSTVTVDYQKSGGDQIVNLTFDRIPANLVNATVNKITYPENSQVFLTMNDPQLNIDPTEDDSWTWGTSAGNNTLYYQAFNRNGAPDADGTAGMQNLVGNLTTFMFNHNGKLTINPAAQGIRVIDFSANGKQILNGTTTARGNPATLHTSSIAPGSEPVTFSESGGVNTGVFANWDGAKKSNIVTVNSVAIRGQYATFRYNDHLGNITGRFVIPLQPGSISDGHTYPNGNYITIPFVSVNNTALTIDFPEGVLFAQGDPTNHNNTYVPVQLRPIDPNCSPGQFYSESGQCLWAPDMCSNGSSPFGGQCYVSGSISSPTMCSAGASINSAGFCFSPPQCPSDYRYDGSSRLCVPIIPWPVDCDKPDANYLNQEGWAWTIPSGNTTTISDRTRGGTNTTTTGTNSTGFVVQWMMPRGSITGYEAGVFYNPVNFYQNVPSDTTGKKYMFYQVDYGIGKVLGNRQGLIMTFEPGGSGNYAFIKLNDVIITPGSKYWITGVLEPAPLANPPAYVVQIVHGTHSWVYRKEIDDISPSTSPVYRFQSFQDQWISTPFASDLSRDEISYPTIVSIENGNKISIGSFLSSATPYSSLEPASITSSFKLLSPHLTTPMPSQPNTYTDSRDCQGYGNPSTDTNEISGVVPSDPLVDGSYTIIHTPTIPEFGPLVGAIITISIITVITITRRHPSFGN